MRMEWRYPLPPCPSVDGHQPCSPTCLENNLDGWNMTNVCLSFQLGARKTSAKHIICIIIEINKTHQHQSVEMIPQHAECTCSIQPVRIDHTKTCQERLNNQTLQSIDDQTAIACSCICSLEIEWSPNLRLDILSQAIWYTWRCPLTKGIYETGGMMAGDLESKKVLKLSWCFCPHYICSTNLAWLVVSSCFTPWKVCASLGIIIPLIWSKMASFETTNHFTHIGFIRLCPLWIPFEWTNPD